MIALFTCIISCLFLATPIKAGITESGQIQNTNVSISIVNGTTVQVSFSITGTSSMDQLGVTSVSFYRSDGTLVVTRSYTQPNFTYLMANNRINHSGSVSLNCINGYSYYAIVNFYAEKDGESDSLSKTSGMITVNA